MCKWNYGPFGSGEVFRDRLVCHLLWDHDWRFLDLHGTSRVCRRCGLQKTLKTKKQKVGKGWKKSTISQ